MIPASPIPLWQFADAVVIILVSVVTLYLMVTHKRRTGTLLPSISRTVAADKRTSLTFSTMMTVAVPLYYGFIWFWVGPLVSAPWYFYLIVAISIVSEMIFVWAPATSGMSKRIHEITAGFVGLVMFVAPLILLSTGNLSSVAQIGTVLFFGLTAIIAGLLLHPESRKLTLSLEVVYCVAFWAVMSIIAHA
ncbi:MAG: hypothetical protein ABIP74_00595 [Candidatus Saccharimonas sp.]